MKNLIMELPKDLAAAALFFDGFEQCYHPRPLPKLRLSDILHLITCQEFFKTEMFGSLQPFTWWKWGDEPSSNGHPYVDVMVQKKVW